MSTSSGWLMAKAMTCANELDRVQIVTHPPRFVDDWHVCYVSNAVECARRVRGQRSEQCVEVVRFRTGDRDQFERLTYCTSGNEAVNQDAAARW